MRSLFFLGTLLLSATSAPFVPQSTHAQPLSGTGDVVWMLRHAAQTPNGRDTFVDMALDQEGNIYLLAHVTNLVYGRSILLVKYNSAGEKIWRSEYNAGPGEESEPVALAVDQDQNAYVLGRSTKDGSLLAIVTIKYDKSGNRAWLSRYDGSGTGDDRPIALAVDDDRSVYIAGHVQTEEAGFDIITIKYDAAGQQEWIRQYDGPDGRTDIASDIGLGSDGSIFVTGTSWTAQSSVLRIITLRYSPAGDLLWQANHESPRSDTRAVGLAIDSLGQAHIAATNGRDYIAIKYDAAGAEQWVRHANRKPNYASYPKAIAVDLEGNVYLTGSGNFGDDDYFTVKYGADGEELWRAIYDAEGRDDIANAVAVDSAGNVYVTGRSYTNSTGYDYATVKYDANGAQQWVSRYKGPKNSGLFMTGDKAAAIALVPDGLVVSGNTMTLSTSTDLATLKYNLQGEEQWEVVLNGPGKTEGYLRFLDIDNADNVYLAGSIPAEEPLRSFAVSKYSPQGVELWTKQYGPTQPLYNQLKAMTVAPDGSVYLAGTSYTDYQNADILVVKYNSDGQQQWDFRSPIPNLQRVYSLAVDAAGNVAITTNSDPYAVMLLNASGDLMWASPPAMPGEIRAVLFDAGGAIYAVGVHQNERYVFTSKYSPDGNLDWTDQIAEAIITASTPSFAALDSAYLYLAFTRVLSRRAFLTAKYRFDGQQEWLAEHEIACRGYDGAIALALNDFGDVYVTGLARQPETGINYLTIKYNADGNEQWAVRYIGENGIDLPRSVAVDPMGNVLVTGTSIGPIGSFDGYSDYATVMYSPDGNQVWSARYNGPGNRNDEATALAVDSKGHVIVLGRSTFSIRGSGFYTSNIVVNTTIKYLPSGPLSVKALPTAMVPVARLEQNYPNPFNPATTFRFSLSRPSFITLRIYNLLGEEVETLVSGHKLAGEYEIRWNSKEAPAGIYYYELRAGTYTERKRFVLLR
jgi:uncharacterized delta-60 repeat protein